MDRNSTIFIAGGAGLIGQACVRQFQQRGYASILAPSRQELDLADTKAVGAYFQQNNIDIVVLAAGKVGGILENKNNPVDFLNVNLPIQMNVCEAAQHSDCQKVVLFGSSCIYPKHCSQPMKAEDLFTGKLEPTSMAYALSKIVGLQHGFSCNHQFGTDKFLGIIPNSAYGPGDNFNPESGHVLSALIHRFHQAKASGADRVILWGSGSPRREFLFSDDIADAIIFLLEQGVSTPDLPINIGSGLDYSIKELAETIQAEIDFKGEIDWDHTKPDGAPRKLLDSSALQSLGWQAATTLKNGIEKTYRWYLDNRV
ncbi:GDP-L-fucose synthase [Alphaproteobacteria bacterium]|nr:GDP-L-fucose synthase [Alphaproteobacteria bacterium]